MNATNETSATESAVSEAAATSSTAVAGEGGSEAAAAGETAEGAATAEGEKVKRAYTSPRANFAAAVVAKLDELSAKWNECEDMSKVDVLSVLSLVKTSVAEILVGDTSEGGEKRTRAPNGEGNKFVGKHWWLGRTATGEYVAIDSTKSPTPKNHPTMAHIYGPAKTKAGLDYRVTKQDPVGLPEIF